jgi:hypothetical protein
LTGKLEVESLIGKTSLKWEVTLKLVLTIHCAVVCTGFIWLKVEANGREAGGIIINLFGSG